MPHPGHDGGLHDLLIILPWLLAWMEWRSRIVVSWSQRIIKRAKEACRLK